MDSRHEKDAEDETNAALSSVSPLIAVGKDTGISVEDLPKQLQFILQKDRMKVLPKLALDKRKTNLVCPVCTEYLFVPENQNVSVIIDCGHSIHTECKKWLMKDAHLVSKATSKPLVEPRCPICFGIIRWKK